MPSFANWFTNEEGIDKYGCKFEGTDGKPHISQRSEEEQRQAAAFCARYLRRHLQEWERQRRTSKGKEDAGAPEDAGVPGDAPSEELGDEDGEVDLDETQVYLSNTNFVFALETLRSVPPRVAVRHHQTVATLLAGCRHDISKRGGEYDAVLSLQTLAYMGPQTVAEHFEEIIETGILGRSRRAGEPWPERYVPPPRPTERSCQGEGGLDCVQHLQLQKPWLRYECAKAVWLALSVLEPEHLLALEAQGQPPVTELARRGLIHIDTAREALNSMSGPSVHMANLVDAIEQGVEKARAERGGSLPGYSADVVTDPESMLSTFRAERVAWSRELHTSFPPAVREYAWRLYLIGGELERRGFLNSQLWCDVIMPLVVTAAVRRAGIDPPPNFLPDEEVDLSDLSAEEVDMLRAPPGQRCSAYLESTRPAREAEEAAKEAQKARQREDGKRYYAERKARLEMPFSQLSGEFAMAEGCLHKLIYAMDQVAQGAEVDFKLLEEEAESVRREFERLKRAGQERVKAGVGSENEDLRLAAERRAAVALQVRQVLRYPERARSSARKLVLREEGRRQEEEKELRMRSILREFQLKLDKVKWDLQRVSQLIEAPDGVWMSNLHMQVDLHSQVERTWHDALRLSEASRERANIEGGAAFAQLAKQAQALGAVAAGLKRHTPWAKRPRISEGLAVPTCVQATLISTAPPQEARPQLGPSPPTDNAPTLFLLAAPPSLAAAAPPMPQLPAAPSHQWPLTQPASYSPTQHAPAPHALAPHRRVSHPYQYVRPQTQNLHYPKPRYPQAQYPQAQYQQAQYPHGSLRQPQQLQASQPRRPQLLYASQPQVPVLHYPQAWRPTGLCLPTSTAP